MPIDAVLGYVQFASVNHLFLASATEFNNFILMYPSKILLLFYPVLGFMKFRFVVMFEVLFSFESL
jgi:hypothetical protein